jgi:hypothetical protein
MRKYIPVRPVSAHKARQSDVSEHHAAQEFANPESDSWDYADQVLERLQHLNRSGIQHFCPRVVLIRATAYSSETLDQAAFHEIDVRQYAPALLAALKEPSSQILSGFVFDVRFEEFFGNIKITGWWVSLLLIPMAVDRAAIRDRLVASSRELGHVADGAFAIADLHHQRDVLNVVREICNPKPLLYRIVDTAAEERFGAPRVPETALAARRALKTVIPEERRRAYQVGVNGVPQ